MFKRSDYAFDKQRGLDVPEGVYPRKESDIVYFSEKFEETPIERATKLEDTRKAFPAFKASDIKNLDATTKKVLNTVFSTRKPATDLFKDLFNTNTNEAREYLSELLYSKTFGGTKEFGMYDVVSESRLNKVKKNIYDLTQKKLESYPEKMIVYRTGSLDPRNLKKYDVDASDIPTSFTLNPEFDPKSLPWNQRQNYPPLEKYEVNKKDILASADLYETNFEDEIIIRPKDVKLVEETASKQTDDMLINMLGDEGIGAEHPNIQEAVNKYVYDVDKSSIEKAIASPDYPAYKADLQRILKKEFPDGKIPVTRILNYASRPDGKKPKKVKSVLDIEDIAFAGNEAERELIANLNGDLTSFSIDNVKNQMNRGGVPTMQKKNIESQQLELFGGMKDQGGTKDPVSGNDVPVGSTKKEVRDDIPAQLSEGEFVLPADVVRYHGLEKIMGLRDQAKQGLNKMEAMGQMGNSDEATLPDDTPFMAQAGGVAGVNVQDPTQLQKQKSVFQTRNPYGQQPQMPPPFMPIIEPPKPPKVEAPATAPRTFKDTMGGTEFGELPTSEQRQYKNTATGETKSFTFVNGKPVYPIPAGFVPIEEAGVEAPDVVKDVLVPTTQVTKEDKDRPSVSQVAGEGSFSLGNLNIGSLAGGALGSMFLGPLGGIIGSKIGGQLGQTTDPQLGGSFSDVATGKFSGSPALGYAGLPKTNKVGTNVGDIDVNTRGTFNNSFAVADNISDLHKYGGAMRDANGHTVYRTINEQVKSLKAASKTGWFGGPLSPMEYHGLTDANKIKYNNYATEAGFNEQNYGTGKGLELYNEFASDLSKYNISGTNQAPPVREGDGYLVSNGKAYKGKYVVNNITKDLQFEKEGGGTIISSGGSGLVGDLTGSGQKTKIVNVQKDEPEPNLEAEYKKQQQQEKARERELADQAEKIRTEKLKNLAERRKIQEDEAKKVAARKAEQERIRKQNQRDQDKADREARREAEKSKTGTFDRDFQRDSSGRRNYKKGGLMTKPAIKNMKRGGLASR
jgi:hypothetical protein